MGVSGWSRWLLRAPPALRFSQVCERNAANTVLFSEQAKKAALWEHTYRSCLPYPVPGLTWAQKDHLFSLPLGGIWSSNLPPSALPRCLEICPARVAAMAVSLSQDAVWHQPMPNTFSNGNKENHFPDPFCSKEERPLALLALFHGVGPSTFLALGFCDAQHAFTWRSLGHFHRLVPWTLGNSKWAVSSLLKHR